MSTTVAPRAVTVGFVLWLGLALALGATGIFASLRPPAPQLVILGLTVAALLATRTRALREWVDRLPLRLLVGIHGVRFVGVVFLVLAAQGALSQVFAQRAGWGDIIAAALALLLVAWGPPNSTVRRWSYVAWGVFGIFDLFVAVGTATMVVWRGDVPGMEPLFRVPLILVPTFFVPLLLVSHVVVFRRVFNARGDA